ncbi:hypothetical protein ACSBR1_040857 [Camellia fascicularis]
MPFISKISALGSQNLPAPTRKIVWNGSISGRSSTKQLHTSKNRTTQMEAFPKVQTESFESVRLRMRESLASALALQVESTYVPADAADHASKNLTDSLPLKESCSDDKANDGYWS